jgi:hypothetical protein
MCGHVKLFGAVGDEKTDDTQAFQDAIDFCADNGPSNHCPGEVLVPPGNYRIAGTLHGKGITLKRCNEEPKQEDAPDTLPEIPTHNECHRCGECILRRLRSFLRATARDLRYPNRSVTIDESWLRQLCR